MSRELCERLARELCERPERARQQFGDATTDQITVLKTSIQAHCAQTFAHCISQNIPCNLLPPLAPQTSSITLPIASTYATQTMSRSETISEPLRALLSPIGAHTSSIIIAAAPAHALPVAGNWPIPSPIVFRGTFDDDHTPNGHGGIPRGRPRFSGSGTVRTETPRVPRLSVTDERALKHNCRTRVRNGISREGNA